MQLFVLCNYMQLNVHIEKLYLASCILLCPFVKGKNLNVTIYQTVNRYKYTLRVPHVEQELAYPSRAPAFTPVQCFVDQCFFLPLVIVLSVLFQCAASYCPFGVFKPFLNTVQYIYINQPYLNSADGNQCTVQSRWNIQRHYTNEKH